MLHYSARFRQSIKQKRRVGNLLKYCIKRKDGQILRSFGRVEISPSTSQSVVVNSSYHVKLKRFKTVCFSVIKYFNHLFSGMCQCHMTCTSISTPAVRITSKKLERMFSSRPMYTTKSRKTSW